MILVDTSVWSRAYRRRARPVDDAVGARLRELISAGEPVALPGIVLQELLSGLRHETQLVRLERVLAPFPLVLATRADHAGAARIRNACGAAGFAASSIDSLIAAQAVERDATLFAADGDFTQIAEHSALRLFRERSERKR